MFTRRGRQPIFVAGTFAVLLFAKKVCAQSPRDYSRQLDLMGFLLEKNTIADVESKLGTATPGACSQDADASKIICYVSTGPNKVHILFESGLSF